MRIGFTGTRKGMNIKQLQNLYKALSQQFALEFHHGDCFGADQEAHVIARLLGYEVWIHPPIDDTFRAFCKSDKILPAKPYLERNHDIVNSVDLLIAAPDGPEMLRSGTWATIRFAKETKTQLFILAP
jgi:hypothetical protein